LLCFLALLFDQLVFIGNINVTKGVQTVQSSIDGLLSIVHKILLESESLYSDGTDLRTSYKTLETTCTIFNASTLYLNTYINKYQTEIISLEKTLKSVSNLLETAETDYLEKYAMNYRTIAIYIIWGLGIFSIFFFLWAKWKSSMKIMKLAIGVSCFVYLLFLLLGIPWVIATSVGGDFCMDPVTNVLNEILPSSSSSTNNNNDDNYSGNALNLHDLVFYYSKCEGNSSLSNLITSSYSQITTLNTSLAEITYETCTGSNSTEYNQLLVAEIKANFTASILKITISTDKINDDYLACEPLQYILLQFLQTGVCSELYSGFFFIWFSQCITSFWIFSLMLTSAFTYQFYEMNKIAPDPNTAVMDEREGNNMFLLARKVDTHAAIMNDDDDDDPSDSHHLNNGGGGRRREGHIHKGSSPRADGLILPFNTPY
jgi:hypothetical protein